MPPKKRSRSPAGGGKQDPGPPAVNLTDAEKGTLSEFSTEYSAHLGQRFREVAALQPRALAYVARRKPKAAR